MELLKSEIKKVEKVASKTLGKGCKLSGWYTDNKIDDIGFANFRCEVSDANYERTMMVKLEVFTLDRRRSWAH